LACRGDRLLSIPPEANLIVTNDLSVLAVLTSFSAGVISFLSPCVLPLVPGYISYVAGQSLSGTVSAGAIAKRPAALVTSLLFVLGFSTVFVTLGASATMLGHLMLSYRYEANLVGGAVVIVFGIFTLGLFGLPWLQRDFRFHLDLPGGRPAAAYVLGLAFAFGWTPCIGPILGTILTTSAVSATAAQGVGLLAVYSLGLGLPFLAAAAFTDALLAQLHWLRRAGRSLQIGAGTVIVAMGIAMITGQLSAMSYWLLETFPAFARIG
jgi:cytochrome c-type biogenesis protein